uniref:IS3 family transposase n=1 Tax=Solibacillus sp. FSL K6-1781 TaxID=2921474 RepID=UPI00406BF1F9
MGRGSGGQLISYKVLHKKINEYVQYYINVRIKQKLAGMSPVNYRKHASQLAA